MEAVVALLLGGFLLHLGLTTMHQLQLHEARTRNRRDALLAERIARVVLRGELARADGTWRVGEDSVALRSYRGTGIVCGPGPATGELIVAYRGDRLPDPRKDSVELTTETGVVSVFALASTEPGTGACPGAAAGEETMRWSVDGLVPLDVVMARVFESGTYHLVGSALRYRIGRGGRQPLTPRVWEDERTGFGVGDAAVRLELHRRAGYGAGSSTEFLVWRRR